MALEVQVFYSMDHREDKAEEHIFDDGEGTIEEATSLI